MKIVICGSMKVKDSLIKAKKELESIGYETELPIECMNGEPKIVASRAHFDRIVSPDTDAILVVNEEKNGIENYIGPNSFAEIAFAFYYHKKIFLLNDIYEPYKDELMGWNAISLHHNIEKIGEYL